MGYKSLEEKIQAYGGNAASMMQNAQTGRYQFPVPPEFSNWIEEQRAWRESAALMDQSFHMTDVYFEGPDVRRLLSDVGVNTLKNFAANKVGPVT